MSTTRNKGCGYAVLVGITIIFTILLIFVILLFVPTASLLWSGISAQGTIVAAQSCQTGGKEPGCNYTVQFTDRAGQVHLATLHGKDVTMPDTSSFTIVYLANDPETIDLPSALPMRFGLALGLVIFLALIDLPLIGLLVNAWIKHSRNQRRRVSEEPL